MNQTQRLWALPILLGCLIGCGENANVPSNVAADQKTDSKRQSDTQRVIAWAEKAGISASTGVCKASIGKTDVPLDWDEWLAEGRAIPGAENILLELLEQKDERLHPILAVQGLGFVGTTKCVPVLAELAKGEDLDFDAVCALADLALPECMPPLLKQLFLDDLGTMLLKAW